MSSFIPILKAWSSGPGFLTTTLRLWLFDVESAGLLGLPEGTPVFHRSIVIRDPPNRIILVSEWLATTTSFVREVEIPVGGVEGC